MTRISHYDTSGTPLYDADVAYTVDCILDDDGGSLPSDLHTVMRVWPWLPGDIQRHIVQVAEQATRHEAPDGKAAAYKEDMSF